MKENWQIQKNKIDENELKEIKTYSETFKIGPHLIELLFSRGLKNSQEIDRFLNPRLVK